MVPGPWSTRAHDPAPALGPRIWDPPTVSSSPADTTISLHRWSSACVDRWSGHRSTGARLVAPHEIRGREALLPTLDPESDEIVGPAGNEVGPAAAGTMEAAMPPLLPGLTKSRNELAHHLSAFIVELGLSADELMVLWFTTDPQRPTAARIRRHLGMHPSTFNSLVARLVYRGYVTTEPCRFDRRTRYLVVTRPGWTALGIARSIQLEIEAAARPHDADVMHERLVGLGILTEILPWPRRMDDGLPNLTA
jgi:DNA-binding MarR family transcriptional regulator